MNDDSIMNEHEVTWDLSEMNAGDAIATLTAITKIRSTYAADRAWVNWRPSIDTPVLLVRLPEIAADDERATEFRETVQRTERFGYVIGVKIDRSLDRIDMPLVPLDMTAAEIADTLGQRLGIDPARLMVNEHSATVDLTASETQELIDSDKLPLEIRQMMEAALGGKASGPMLWMDDEAAPVYESDPGSARSERFRQALRAQMPYPAGTYRNGEPAYLPLGTYYDEDDDVIRVIEPVIEPRPGLIKRAAGAFLRRMRKVGVMPSEPLRIGTQHARLEDFGAPSDVQRQDIVPLPGKSFVLDGRNLEGNLDRLAQDWGLLFGSAFGTKLAMMVATTEGKAALDRQRVEDDEGDDERA